MVQARRHIFVVLGLILFASCVYAQQRPVLMNMVHHNPGEPMTVSKYLDPSFLKKEGYGAKVFFLFDAAQFGVNWQLFDKTIFPNGDAGRKWVDQKAALFDKEYTETKKQGLKVYCMIDMIVLPKALVNKYRDIICDGKGRIDISRPFTQKCVRSMLNQLFDRFPQLDGLVIRTGETYLRDAPFYVGNNPLLHGLNDHVILLNILRNEVCVKRHKDIFYRTWDFGRLHSLPQDYLQVTNQVAPHPNLYFSIKHIMVDFWRGATTGKMPDLHDFKSYWINEADEYGVPFNPCLGIGRHKQVVEVQCQREYEGKGAHPNYIAAGVINGFDELESYQKIVCLNQFRNNWRYAGVWTWARGGGWGGPFIGNEFWCELNADVMARWVKQPALKETELFRQFALSKGLPLKEVPLFHQLCLLSARGVMEGQYSRMGNDYILWTRDDAIAGLQVLKSFFDKIINGHKIEDYINEKQDAVETWRQIDSLAGELHFKNDSLNHFVRVSCKYGFIKYAIMATAYEIMLRGYELQKSDRKDFSSLSGLINKYDRLWWQWGRLKKENDDCPTIYARSSDYGYSGMDKTIASFRVK